MNGKRQIAMIVFCAASLFGGERTVFYVHTGTSMPLSPTAFKDTYSQGYNVGIAAGRRLTRTFEIQAMLHLNNAAFDSRGYMNVDPDITDYTERVGDDPEVDIEGGAATIWNLSLNAKLAFPSGSGGKGELYILAGAGLFGLHKGKIEINDYQQQLPNSTGRLVRPAANETVFGVTAGFGVEIMLDRRSNFFFELAPCIGFTSGDPTVLLPVKFGISIHGKTAVGIQVTNPDYP
jgi:hypothetical protein